MQKFISGTNNSKKSYNVINEALGRQPRDEKISEITVNGTTFKKKYRGWKHIDEYFSEIGTRLAGNFRDSTDYLNCMTNLSIRQRIFEFTPLTLNDLESVLKSLKCSSPGCDRTPM